MSTNDGNDQAFPSENYGPGMTLRDYLAAKAMQAHITACEDRCSDGPRDIDYSLVAVVAYKQADAMLKARDSK